MSTERPLPEQLLKQVKEETKRGKLKIFFGACAGVGKTYAMLLAAQEKRKEKLDIVAGYIETHGREETYKLLEGIPCLPLRMIEYRGIKVREFDLDAALARKPKILIVDELAHSNISGSRHPKRWQDVDELLDAGIDVYSTLNVQHLESLNDMIANITGVQVKETIPDGVFDKADEIVLIDVPSEVIIQRLNDGKVYLGEFAKQRAAQHFFKIENLIALREIALRRTAERVDALRDLYHKYQDPKLAISDQLLVCIGPGTLSTKLVRTAKQLATKLKAPWAALYIENDEYYSLDKEEQNAIQKTLHLAEQLGAKSRIIQSPQTVDAILDFARKNNFTKIILGHSTRSSWKQRFFGSLVNKIIQKSGPIDIYVITEESPHVPLKKTQTRSSAKRIFFQTSLFFIISTLLAWPAQQLSEPATALLLYITGIVILAVHGERMAAILGAFLSVFAYNFFFIHPYYSLSAYHISNILTLTMLLLTGVLISTQTSRLRQQHLIAQQRANYTAELYALSRKLNATTGKNKLARVVSHHISEIFESAATVWLPNQQGQVKLISHPSLNAEVKEESVAQWCFLHKQVAGSATNTMPSARGYYLPLLNDDKIFGVLGVIPKDPQRTFTVEENLLLESLAFQTASALERIQSAQEKNKNKNVKEK